MGGLTTSLPEFLAFGFGGGRFVLRLLGPIGDGKPYPNVGQLLLILRLRFCDV